MGKRGKMQEKKIVMASDHAGYQLKKFLYSYLKEKGFRIIDYGTNDANISVDYPDEAYLLAKGIYLGDANFGILICGSGIGMSIAVNRYSHIRGALVSSPEMAELARRHNDANVLILGGRFINEKTAIACVEKFFSTTFDGGRHEGRVCKLRRMPNEF